MKIMKKLLAVIFSVFLSGNLLAQNQLAATDDIGRIALTPIIIEESNVPSYARNVLSNKLKQIVTQNGLASTSTSPRFVITAAANLLNKEITATAPAMVAVELSVTLYIGDAHTGQLFATHSYNTVKGLGTNDQRAYLSAFKLLKATPAEMNAFVDKGKQKIIEYYNSQIDFLLAEAQSLSAQEKYDDAMALLASVPNVCKEPYERALKKISEVYQTKIDVEGAAKYNHAYALWHSNKSKESALKVVELLADINPLSKSAAKGRTLVASVEAHYAELTARRRQIEERNWAFKMQQYQDKRSDIKAEQAYQQQQQKFDYDVAMVRAEKGAEAAELALKEVKSIVSVMSHRKIASWFF